MRRSEALRHLWLLLAALAVMMARPADANDDEDAARALIANWYLELKKGREGRYWTFLAPGGMVVPDYRCPDRDKPQPRGLTGKELLFPHLLVMRMQKFAYEITSLKVETTLARVNVWERGWTYAWAAKQTYENAADAKFILEKREGGDWKIVLYSSSSQAIRRDHVNDPMPDLSPKDK